MIAFYNIVLQPDMWPGTPIKQVMFRILQFSSKNLLLVISLQLSRPLNKIFYNYIIFLNIFIMHICYSKIHVRYMFIFHQSVVFHIVHNDSEGNLVYVNDQLFCILLTFNCIVNYLALWEKFYYEISKYSNDLIENQIIRMNFVETLTTFHHNYYKSYRCHDIV